MYKRQTQDLGVASNGQQAALVWAEHSNVSDALGRYHFALVNDDLTLSVSACFGEENNNFTPVLGPLPSGWLLAGRVVQDDVSKIQLTVFDAAGVVVSTPSPTLLGTPRHLVARPDGGPLLLYSVSDASGAPTQMASLLDAQGQPVWTVSLGGTRSVIDALAVYTGDGFLWTSVDNLSTSSQVVARIDMTGHVTQATLSLPETDFYADLAWAGQEGHLFWNNYSIRLDKNGKALGPVQQILSVEASQPRLASASGKLGALVRVGRTEGTLGGFLSSSSTGHPELVIVDAQGTASAPFPVFQDGNQGPNFQHHLVPVGDRWLAASVSLDSRLGIRAYLAWIRP